MTQLRKKLPPLPRHMQGLPLDERGYPVPYFVQWIDGKPDFRLLDQEKFAKARVNGLCSVCGHKLGKFKSFVGGPMNVLQKLSGEPPMHRDCALFSVKACPFLLYPLSKRRDANLPPESRPVGEETDIFYEDNPGITSIWTCTAYRESRTGRTFHFIDMTSLEWFTEGRGATADEIKTALIAARERLIKLLTPSPTSGDALAMVTQPVQENPT